MVEPYSSPGVNPAANTRRPLCKPVRWAAPGAVLIASVLLLAPAAHAQQGAREPLVTDRPDATESAQTLTRGRFQLESGFTYQRVEDLRLLQVGEVLLRAGLVDRLEIRLGLNSYVHEELGSAASQGLEDSSVGIKYKLVDASRSSALGRPDVAVLFSTTLPTGASAVSNSAAQPELRLASAWELPAELGLGVNLSYRWAEDAGIQERFNELGTSVALSCALTEGLGAFVEHFGSYPLADWLDDEQFVNGGFTILLTNDTQLDARVGYGLNGRDDDVFVGFGSAFRW